MVIRDVDLGLDRLIPLSSWMSGHSQTLISHFVPSPRFSVDLKAELFQLSDGDFCGLHIYRNSSENKKNITLSLFHGLSGNIQADYMQRTAKLGAEYGFDVVLVEHRGNGIASGQAKKPYHSGRGDDMSQILRYLKTIFPMNKNLACGFSMSGSILLNLLTGRSGDFLPEYSISINAPLDLKDASEKLQKGISNLYDQRFFYKLKNHIEKYYNLKVPKFGTTADIDDLFTSQYSGYKNKLDYYEQCSVFPYLNQIQVPTFVLTAKDDPFVDSKYYSMVSWPEVVHLTVSQFGGHMGYYSRQKIEKFERRWLDYYLDSVFQYVLKLERNEK